MRTSSNGGNGRVCQPSNTIAWSLCPVYWSTDQARELWTDLNFLRRPFIPRRLRESPKKKSHDRSAASIPSSNQPVRSTDDRSVRFVADLCRAGIVAGLAGSPVVCGDGTHDISDVRGSPFLSSVRGAFAEYGGTLVCTHIPGGREGGCESRHHLGHPVPSDSDESFRGSVAGDYRSRAASPCPQP